MEVDRTTVPDAEVYVVGISGGKDSTATAIWALDNLSVDKIRLAHNPTGAAWPETAEYLKYLRSAFGMIIHNARSGDYPLPLRRDGKPRDAWYSAPTLLQMVAGRGRWPSFWQRYCTRYLKQVPIRQYAHAESDSPMLILGSRREESRGRKKLPRFDPDDDQYRDWVRYRTPIYYPIVDWTESQVWELLRSRGINKNPVYEYVDRCSCWCCPLRSSVDAITKFASLYPEIAQQAVDVERQCGHTWQYKKSLAEIIKT